jgi:hypothetical protein
MPLVDILIPFKAEIVQREGITAGVKLARKADEVIPAVEV